MKKIKKIIVGIFSFLNALIIKVYAVIDVNNLEKVIDTESDYGIPRTIAVKSIFRIFGIIAIPLAIIIGIIVYIKRRKKKESSNNNK